MRTAKIGAEAALAQQPLARLEDEDRLVGDGDDLDLAGGAPAISSSLAWTSWRP